MYNNCQIYSLRIAALSFKMRFNFFILQRWNIETSRFRKLLWLQLAYKLLFPSLTLYYLHDGCLLMSWRNIIFTFFCNLFTLMVADDAFKAFSDNDRRHCRSVAQTSALLCRNKWTSLRTFALTL